MIILTTPPRPKSKKFSFCANGYTFEDNLGFHKTPKPYQGIIHLFIDKANHPY